MKLFEFVQEHGLCFTESKKTQEAFKKSLLFVDNWLKNKNKTGEKIKIFSSSGNHILFRKFFSYKH